METIELNTGIQIPVIGSGTNTFGKENREYQGAINDDTTELLTAIKLGYRPVSYTHLTLPTNSRV